MNLRIAKVVFWVVLTVVLLLLPIVAHPIEYGSLIMLPLGAGFAVARKIARVLHMHGHCADVLIMCMMAVLCLVQIVSMFVITFTNRRRTFFVALLVIVVLLLLDINGCRQSLNELKSIS